MKTPSILVSFSLLFFALFAQAQTKTDAVQSETIKVWGNCGMCKSHIEKAAKQAGASYADWNKNTKMLLVKYEPSKTNSKQIQQQIAYAGYDTRDFTADDKAYHSLDECCQYDRKAASKDGKAKQ